MKPSHWCWRGWLEVCSARSSSAGLWWTVRLGVSSKQPALWFLVSLLLRMAIVLAGFYFRRGRPLGAIPGLWPGLCLARPIVTWLTRPAEPSKTAREASHAPQS